MTHGPGLTYDLAISRMDERTRVSTGAADVKLSTPNVGRVRGSLGAKLIAIGEWLGGSARVTPATGTN